MRRFDVRRWRAAAVVKSWMLRLEVAAERPGWAERAACRGLPAGFMFPETRSGEQEAVEVCERCPVRLPCLAAARRVELPEHCHGVFGVRGGLRAVERAHVYRGMHPRPATFEMPESLHPLVAAVMAAELSTSGGGPQHERMVQGETSAA